jgi:hypothetical protein
MLEGIDDASMGACQGRVGEGSQGGANIFGGERAPTVEREASSQHDHDASFALAFESLGDSRHGSECVRIE